ncbi:: DUF2934 [Gemmataceae bacterium]|nr:: DUF2934 [Gemmataceae bacterium]VTT98644.1 : DUF2934 [Gemmataceae bacterium]
MSKHHGRSTTVARAGHKTTEPSRERQVRSGEKADEDRLGANIGVPLEEAIRVRAYQNWDRAGRPEGDGVSFWLEAEAELTRSAT